MTLAQYLTISEAARVMGVTAATLRNWDRAGKLRPTRNPANRYRLYRREDLEGFLARLDDRGGTATLTGRGTRARATTSGKQGP